MASVATIRSAEEAEKLANFRQKRLAKKIADREKLEAEFPLIFGNKQKPVIAYPSKYTTKINPSTPGKRKITVTNDENAVNGTNSVAQKPSNIPTSAAKKAKLSATLSGSQPLTSSKKVSSIPVSTKQAKRSFLSLVFPSRTKLVEQESVVVQNVHESPSIPAESIPVLQNVESSMSFAQPESIVAEHQEAEPVEETVRDVLDYLLESNEVDENTHKRLSRQSFTAHELKRLSVGVCKRVSFALPTDDSAKSKSTQNREIAEEGSICEEETSMVVADIANSDYIGELDALYEPIREECQIGDMDILFALRNYISTLDASPVKPEVSEQIVDQRSEEQNVQVDSGEAAPGIESFYGEVDDQAILHTSIEEIVTTLDYESVSFAPIRPEEVPMYVSLDNEIEKASGRKITFNRRLSTESALDGNETGLHTINNPSLSPSTRDTNLDTTITNRSVTFELEDAFNCTTDSIVGDLAIANRETISSSDSNTVSASKLDTIITYPRTQSLQNALIKGIIEVTVFGHIETADNHIQYMIDVAIPSSLTEEGVTLSSMKMFLLKRFSEFKEFRQELCSAVVPEQIMEWQFAGEPMEVIPPLKSKRSSLCSKMENEEKSTFYKERQELLSAWFRTVLSNQKMLQNPEYRMKLQEFFSC